jgi:chromosome segregation ATPase
MFDNINISGLKIGEAIELKGNIESITAALTNIKKILEYNDKDFLKLINELKKNFNGIKKNNNNVLIVDADIDDEKQSVDSIKNRENELEANLKIFLEKIKSLKSNYLYNKKLEEITETINVPNGKRNVRKKKVIGYKWIDSCSRS